MPRDGRSVRRPVQHQRATGNALLARVARACSTPRAGRDLRASYAPTPGRVEAGCETSRASACIPKPQSHAAQRPACAMSRAARACPEPLPPARVARASLSCGKRLTRRPSRATGPGRGGGETARARLGMRRIASRPNPQNDRTNFSFRIPFYQSDPGPCAAAQPPERVYLGRKLPPTGTRLHHRFPGPPGAPPPEIRKAPAMASTQRPHGGGPAWEET